ncbi:hypothetical protein MRX96_047164 [Rhipicephalus microplus]
MQQPSERAVETPTPAAAAVERASTNSSNANCAAQRRAANDPPVEPGTMSNFMEALARLRADIAADRVADMIPHALQLTELHARLQILEQQAALQYDDESKVPYLHKEKLWVSYDDQESVPLKKEPCETPIAMEQLPLSSSGIQSTSSEALQAGLSEPGEEASGGGIEPASPRSTAEPLPLRRSTRARKPPDRF